MSVASRHLPPLVLASASPRRRDLLAALGAPFEVRAADVPEPLVRGRAAVRQAMDLARAKAAAIAAERPHPAVLGADTIVVLDGVPLGKPADADAARRMLRGLRGRTHEVITGVTVIGGGSTDTACAVTTVTMRGYTDAEIDAYIAGGDPFDKAGAYAIQHSGFRPVERIDGCYCNVVGLPLWTVRRLLARQAPERPTAPPDATYDRCRTCPLADPARRA